MNDIVACMLGCRSPDGIPYRAAPGHLACTTCANKLATLLTAIGTTYIHLQTVAALTPGGHGNDGGTHRVPGPRSPAVDALIVHSDPRSAWDGHPAALATIASWARLVREERNASTPHGRITMTRELDTLRFHWDWVLGQLWLDELAGELHAILAALQTIGRLAPKIVQLGNCSRRILTLVLDGEEIPLYCGARIRVRVGDEEIRCRNCGSVWPRGQWHELGDPRTDYASLSVELSVPVGTLKRWAHEDHWDKTGTRGRPLVPRAAAFASYTRRRGALPLGEAG